MVSQDTHLFFFKMSPIVPEQASALSSEGQMQMPTRRVAS